MAVCFRLFARPPENRFQPYNPDPQRAHVPEMYPNNALNMLGILAMRQQLSATAHGMYFTAQHVERDANENITNSLVISNDRRRARVNKKVGDDPLHYFLELY